MLDTPLTRRAVLRASAGLALAANLPRIGFADGQRVVEYRLKAAATQVPVIGSGYPETAVWTYNNMLPGPEIRLRQGDRLQVTLENTLEQATTVHWHGLRLPNAMDGVPYLTQPPIAPGEQFVYEFEPPDAGTYWYHPHINSSEQVGRGLYGALIVEEPTATTAESENSSGTGFDRELVWLLDDWRFDKTATIQPFGQGHDISHGGRLGNFITINGRRPQALTVRAGERLRLRLINVANARHFALHFEGYAPQIIAIDGQSVAPHAPVDDLIVLAPAMRTDILLDMSGQPGITTRIIDTFYRKAYVLNELVYDSTPLRQTPLAELQSLPANPLSEPDLASATRHEFVFAGGAMGGMRGAMLNGHWADIRTMARSGMLWAINGVAAHGQIMEPLLTLELGKSYIFSMRNDTAFPHPIHMHGHHYRVLSRNGQQTRFREWQDSVLMRPREQVEVAFVADNPGDWMFHCHVPEHMEAGMMGVIRVA
ncbi:MAG: multicopper oxidase family protein [Candidatus Competibacteraceae bacterium]|nr:multicopper oxidase family protein [Candidatus Competibacteraceae bacterium]